MFSSFRESIESSWEDRITIFHRAINNAQRLDGSAHVIAFGHYDFNELQWRLINRVSKTTDTTLFVPYLDEEAYRFAAGTIERLREMGFELTKAEKSGAREESKRIELINAPGEEEEVRGVVDRMINLVRNDGYSFSDFALLLPQMQGYISIIQEVF